MVNVRPNRPQHPNRGNLCYILVLLLPLLACASSTMRSGSLPIDDFEDGDLESRVGLAWMPLADDQLGGNSQLNLAIARPGANGSRAALRITGKVAEGFQFPFAGVWALTHKDGLPNDLSAYRGIRFYARGPAGAFQAGLRRSQGRQGVGFVSRFEVKPEWTLVELPFAQLQRYPPVGPAVEFSAKDILLVGISTVGRFQGEVQLEIDEVVLYS